MEDVRLSKYLHKSWLLVAFEAEEWGIIGFAYFIGLMGGTAWWYLGSAVAAYFAIRAFRKLPRGYVEHRLTMAGIYKLQGYPPMFVREFNE